ncbi:hypothetical protein [Streptomyces sp. NPDC051546]|uniref:hypothetical protein n=1 Tax=Streptomyces sp. NPDC051546 TaxID=3365655 RepID=UPI0037ABB51C
MSAKEHTTRFVWAADPSMAWGLVTLRESADKAVVAFAQPHVHGSQEAAMAADAERLGVTLYKIERSSEIADVRTPAPAAGCFAFVFSTDEPHMVWSKVDPEAPAQARSIHWMFPDAAEAVQRAALATQEPRSDGHVFRAYLLTWSVEAVEV